MSMVTDSQFKVLQSSVSILKKKLLEKCLEVDELKKTVAEKDVELSTVRKLNVQLQENLLERILGPPGRPLSLPNSR